jgi:Tfp pilus assembly protein PilX
MNNKGSALLYTVLLLSILLTVVLGLSTLISMQFVIMRNTGDSIVAFYAADAGMEKMLYNVIFLGESPAVIEEEHVSTAPDSATYTVTFTTSGNDGCSATTNLCIESVGMYKGIRRAIKAEI